MPSPLQTLLTEDKAFDSLFPSAACDNTFDEFFNQDLYDVGANESDSHSSVARFEMLPTDAYADEYPRLPSLSGSPSQETSQDQSPPQPWRKGLWCLRQERQRDLIVQKTRKRTTETISATQLIDNDCFAIQSPPSPSLSPTINITKRYVTSPNAARSQHKALDHLPISREVTLSPSPMYAQLPLLSKMEQVETWQQDFRNFNLQQPTSVLKIDNELHDYPSNHLLTSQISNLNHARVAKNGSASASAASNVRPPMMSHGSHGSTLIDHFTTNQTNSGMTMHEKTGLSTLVNHTQSHGQAHLPVWTTESLESSEGSHQSSYDSLPPTASSCQSSGRHLAVTTANLNEWCSPLFRTTTDWSMPLDDIAAPIPKRATQSFVDTFDREYNGLGIQYPDVDHSGPLTLPSLYPSIEHSTHNTPYSPQCMDAPNDLPPVPPLPYLSSSQHFMDTSPFTPTHRRRSPTRDTTPPISPLSMTPRSRRHRSPSRPEQTHHHHRRKSIHKVGPIKDSHAEPFPSSNTMTSHTRSRSTSKPPRTPKTPKTPTGGFSVGFVNFTAKDSAKLLNDVAPSGSSKTRARREAEARDKRKKLNEAALRAVTSAGGDIEALKKAIWA